jgi:hypothetical protein
MTYFGNTAMLTGDVSHSTIQYCIYMQPLPCLLYSLLEALYDTNIHEHAPKTSAVLTRTGYTYMTDTEYTAPESAV